MPEPVHLPDRIEADAHLLWLELMQSDRKLIVQCDTSEYAAGVLAILEGLYPGAGERILFDVVGRFPGTTG
jgi:hypothetical protein